MVSMANINEREVAMQTTTTHTITVWFADSEYGQAEAAIVVPFLDGQRTLETEDWRFGSQLYKTIRRLTVTEWTEGTCYFAADDNPDYDGSYVGDWECCLPGTVTLAHAFRSLTIADLVDAGTIEIVEAQLITACLLYTSPSPRDRQKSRMPSSA